MTSLLDILKETDLRLDFTAAFSTSGSREAVPRIDVQRRLLLCLYGLGTNVGLKRLEAGNNVSYKELLHTRRRYLDKESLRDATRCVVNATLAARSVDVWGEGTSSCAADSKKFGAWDQYLMTEWHIRYGGRGIMIYWHVGVPVVIVKKTTLSSQGQEFACWRSVVKSVFPVGVNVFVPGG